MHYVPPVPMTVMTERSSYTQQVTILDYTDVRARVTAYTVSYEDCGKIDGITASGKRVSRGMIAAPKSIPFGTIITIKGKNLVVEDRGGAIKVQKDGTYNIDYYVETKQQAMKFGVQYLTVRIHGMKQKITKLIKIEGDNTKWKTIKENSVRKNMQEWKDSQLQQALVTQQQSTSKKVRSQKSSILLQHKLLLIIMSCAIVVYLKKLL